MVAAITAIFTISTVAVAGGVDGIFKHMVCPVHLLVVVAHVPMLVEHARVPDLVLQVLVRFPQCLEIVPEMTPAAAAFHLSMKMLRGIGEPMTVNGLVHVSRRSMELPVQVLGGVGEAMCRRSDVGGMSGGTRAREPEHSNKDEYEMNAHGRPPADESSAG